MLKMGLMETIKRKEHHCKGRGAAGPSVTSLMTLPLPRLERPAYLTDQLSPFQLLEHLSLLAVNSVALKKAEYPLGQV